MYELIIKPAAEKQMDRLPAKTRKRITDALTELRKDPRPRGSLKMAGPEGFWRIRVGDYRVVYTIRDDVLLVLVVRVAHRKDAYRGHLTPTRLSFLAIVPDFRLQLNRFAPLELGSDRRLIPEMSIGSKPGSPTSAWNQVSGMRQWS